MAKRKKRRPGVPSRPGGPARHGAPGRTTTRVTTAAGDAPETPAIKPAPAGPGAPNRLVRKEEARRQREALRKQAARRRMLRRGLRWGAVIGVVGAIAVGIWFLSRPPGPTEEESQLLAQAPQAAVAAGCGEVQTIGEYTEEFLGAVTGQDRLHTDTPPALSTYPSQPPTSGPHAGSTLSAGVYNAPQPIGQIIHSMEHGATVIWYDRENVDPTVLADVQTFFRQGGHQDHVIIAPYEYPEEGEAGRLPEGTTMVLTAWHRLRSCDSVSLPVAWAFAHSFAAAPYADYQGEAPETRAGIGAGI